MNDEYDPTGGANFLQRYRQARDAVAATRNTPPVSPSIAPKSSKTKSVWEQVFHPLGRSPTNASRYDLGKSPSLPGQSVSEMHAKGIASISLDQAGEE